MKVPLSVSWLSENGLLQAAGAQLGYMVHPPGDAVGVYALGPDGTRHIAWEDHLTLTLGQLEAIGFEVGPLCECCKRPVPVCSKEMKEMAVRL
jgi:hypothetical protein